MRKDISSHGTGTLSIMRDYPELTVRDYCRLMMGVSDNMATDMIVHLVTPESINATLDGMGYHNTRANMPLGVWHYLMKGVVETPSRSLTPPFAPANSTTGPATRTCRLPAICETTSLRPTTSWISWRRYTRAR